MAPISIALSNTLSPPSSSIDGRAPLFFTQTVQENINTTVLVKMCSIQMQRSRNVKNVPSE